MSSSTIPYCAVEERRRLNQCMEKTSNDYEKGKITGVQTYSGAIYRCKAVVLCTGTYLKARCIYGEISTHTGPNGLQSANYLTDSLKALGIKMYRFKTGTPARIDKNTIDFSNMQEQKEMRGLYRFRLLQILRVFRSIRHPAG